MMQSMFIKFLSIDLLLVLLLFLLRLRHPVKMITMQSMLIELMAIGSDRIELNRIESSFLNSLVLFLLRLRHFVNDAIDIYQIAVDRFIVGDILPVAFEASCKDDYDAIHVN